jgi:hypothetical protein
MRFRNYGGIHQLAVADHRDLAKIGQLDPALWAATSAPLADLHCDPVFLAALDPDGTRRIRVSQLVVARDWVFERLADRAGIAARSDALVLGHVDASREAGARLKAAAADVIKQLGLADAEKLSLADVRAFRANYRKMLANGDGVVPPEAASDPEVAQLVREIVAATGGAKDAGGSDGVGQTELDRFLDGARAWLAWRAREPREAAWGADTAAAGGLVASLDEKIEEFFLRCDLLQVPHRVPDAQAAGGEAEAPPLPGHDPASIEKFLLQAPLAAPVTRGTVSAAAPINPAWREKFDALRRTVLDKALGPSKELDRAAWREVRARFDAFAAWQKEKPAGGFDALGEPRLRAILDGGLPAKLTELIAADRAAAPHIELVGDVEKLILLQRGLVDLVNNFVNFSAIYSPGETALVEMGSLVIDGRRLDFCLKVLDHAAHKKLAAESLIYLVYAHIQDKDGAAPVYEVVAPVTAGERGRFRIGKRGLFIDLEGREWDAQICDIVENPISLREAMFAPFRRVSQFVNRKIEDWAGTAGAGQEKAMVESVEKGAEEAHHAAHEALKSAGEPAPAAAPKPPGKRLDVNALILGGGIALAGISSVLAVIFGLFTTLKGWLAIIGIVSGVLALSAFVGWLKLRRRDMGLILEASGWALNISMKLNRRIGRLFTFTPPLPEGSVKERRDLLKTDEDGAGWKTILLTLLVLAAFGAYWWFALGHRLPAFRK